MARSERKKDLGEPMHYDPDFHGPLKNRSCTDIICLFIFIAFIACWIAIGIYAFKNGDPDILLIPRDSNGGRCGFDSHLLNKPYLFFFDLTKCLSPTVPFLGCPTTQVCVEKCPDKYFFFQSDNYEDLICDYDIKPNGPTDGENYVNQGKCAKWYLKSSSFLNRCLYNIGDRKLLLKGKSENINGDEVTKLKTYLNTFAVWASSVTENTISIFTTKDNIHKVGQNIVNDIITSWWKILIGVGIAVLACIIYILIMRWVAAFMVWLSLIGIIVLLSGAVYFTATKYAELKTPSNDNPSNLIESYLAKRDTWLVLLIISSIILAIVLLILIFLRKRIVLAIALIKEGSKAVSSVTSVLFFPIFPWILQIGVIVFGIFVGLYLTTTGKPAYEIRNMRDCTCLGNASHYQNGVSCLPDIFYENCNSCPSDTTCKFIRIDNPSLYPYFQAINIFGFFWGAFFVSALGQMILASVFATWYWTFKKSNLPFFAVTEACVRVLRYHIGTLAFGSLIITICRIIRVILEYIDHKLKKYDNGITKAILCCCKCFFWCLESFLKFINRNAYIMCAIHGKNFCTSAKDAFMLLMRNILRVFVLDKVTDFLFFLGKLVITLGVGGIAYICFATDLTTIDNSGLNYEFVPVIVIMIATYLIATIFFSVYCMAVDTLFLCFLEDCERNDGSAEKPYYMSRNLMKILGKKNKQH